MAKYSDILDNPKKKYSDIVENGGYKPSIAEQNINALIDNIPDKINEVVGKELLKKAGLMYVYPEQIVVGQTPTVKDYESGTTQEKQFIAERFKQQQDIGQNENYNKLSLALGAIEGIASPITDSLKGGVAGLKRTGEGVSEIAQGKIGEGLLDAGLGIIQTGFSEASLGVPEITAINLGFKGAGMIVPESVMKYIDAPATNVAKDLGIEADTSLQKKALEGLDVLAQIAAFKGAGKLVSGLNSLKDQIKSKATLTPSDLKDLRTINDELAKPAEVVKQDIIPNAEQQTKDLPSLSEVQNAVNERNIPESSKQEYSGINQGGLPEKTSGGDSIQPRQEVPQAKGQVTPIDNNINAIKDLTEQGKSNWEIGAKRDFAFDPNSTKNEGRFRLQPPEKFDSYFRRKSSTEGVSYVMGKDKETGKSKIQAIRFDKNKFNEDQAKEWFDKNKEKYVFSNTSLPETTTPPIETPIVESKQKQPTIETTQPTTDKGRLELGKETKSRFISDESYQMARKNLQEKGMRFSAGLDPTVLKDLTVIGAYHLENIAKAGIEKGKEFAEFSKRMIAELGQEVKPHLLRIYNSTIKEHQKTLEELRTLPEGTKGKPDLHFGGVDERIKPDVQEFYDTHKTEYDQFRGGKIGNKQLINQGLKYASKLTDEDILSMKSRKGIGEVEFVGSHIYGQHRIEQLVKEMDAIDTSTPEGVQSQKAKVDLMAGIFNNIELPKSRSGRILQVSGRLAADNFINALRKLRDSAEKFDPELAKDLTNKLRGAEYEPTLKDKLAFWYYNALLSDPTTDIRNITGNTTMLGSELLSKTLFQSPRETLKMIGDIGRGIKSGMKEASDIYHQRVAEDSKFISTVNKYDIKAKSGVGKFGRLLLPTTRLSMEDAFFRGIAREMAKGKVERVGTKTFGESLENTRQQIERVNNGDLDNLTESQINFMSKGLDYIEHYTDYTTFRIPLGKTASSIESIVRNNWGAKIIMPFVKIGANIIKAGTDYSPLGFGKEAIMRLRGQEINPFELKDIRRRAIAGTLAIGVVVNGVANGSIEVTGQLPSDTFEREAMQAKGYQPNHIYLNLGGKKLGVSYQNINPINIPLSIIGNYSDNLRFGKDIKKQDELSFGDKLGKAILGSAATLADQSYMQGISNLLDAMQRQDPGYFSDIAIGFIPNVAGLPKKIVGDNISYKAKTLEEKAKRKIGITEGLEPNIDIRGEEKTTQLRGLLLPISTVKADPLLDFMKEKDLRISLPSPITRIDNEKLTPSQYTLFQKMVNKNVYNRLSELLPLLKTMDLEEAQKLIDQVSNEEKETAKEILKLR